LGRAISVYTAAVRTGYSVSNVRRLCDAGLIPGAYKMHHSGHWFINEKSFNEWWEGLRQRAIK
jgi:hypothetical protein